MLLIRTPLESNYTITALSFTFTLLWSSFFYPLVSPLHPSSFSRLSPSALLSSRILPLLSPLLPYFMLSSLFILSSKIHSHFSSLSSCSFLFSSCLISCPWISFPNPIFLIHLDLEIFHRKKWKLWPVDGAWWKVFRIHPLSIMGICTKNVVAAHPMVFEIF